MVSVGHVGWGELGLCALRGTLEEAGGSGDGVEIFPVVSNTGRGVARGGRYGESSNGSDREKGQRSIGTAGFNVDGSGKGAAIGDTKEN